MGKKCKHSTVKHVKLFGKGIIILADVDVPNAWEIKFYRHTISSQTQSQTDGSIVMDESNVRTTLYSIANTVTITVPPVCERGVTRLLHNGKLCIVLDGELPIP